MVAAIKYTSYTVKNIDRLGTLIFRLPSAIVANIGHTIDSYHHGRLIREWYSCDTFRQLFYRVRDFAYSLSH
jgi:hypothetical protein